MTDLERERRAAHEGALLEPAPDLGSILVTGADRRRWLNGLVTCELAKLEPGGGAYGLAVAKNGKIFAELWIIAEESRLLLGARRDRVPALLDHFNRYIMMEDAEVADASDELAWLRIHGPLAGELALVARGAGASAAAIAWTDLGGEPLYSLEFVHGRKRHHRDQLDGLGRFHDLRQLLLFEVAR